ncbi:MAG: hypothetical protein FWE22_00750 [Firmicutes bacterium]|nr:hypothetical protein [Bacillota bacterium]
MASYEEKQKAEVSNAILIGYYASYYINGGKKTKNPNDLIQQINNKNKTTKQSLEDGLMDIEKLREFEKLAK